MLLQSHGTGPYEIDLYDLGGRYIVKVKKDGKELYQRSCREHKYAEVEYKSEVERCRSVIENCHHKFCDDSRICTECLKTV